MENDLEDTQEGLAEDTKYLGELGGSCKTKTAEWEAIKKTRAEELLALADTIKMLNDDDALELFKKTLPSPSLLQTKVSAEEELEEQARGGKGPSPQYPAPHHPPPPHHHNPYAAPTPSPYHPAAPHHGVPPHMMVPPAHGYGYTPAPHPYGGPQPHPQGYGYTPAAPGYHPAPAPGYPGGAHPPPPYPQKDAAHHYDGPPDCSKNTTKAWCLEDSAYPAYEISHAIEYNYAGVAALYKDVLANTENSVDRLLELGQETYLCPSVTEYVTPLRAINSAGKWRIIVNGVSAHYETLTQTARIEECSSPGSACPLVPDCYTTSCNQKNIYHRFLVYDPYDHYFPFAMDTFKLPASCACHNGPYVETH